MKKVLSFAMAFLLVLCLAACGSGGAGSTEKAPDALPAPSCGLRQSLRYP